jgi:hypothetical protein
MVASRRSTDPASEDLLARLTSAAYQVALRHGLRGPFIDVELDLWRELRAVLAEGPNERPEVVRWPC